MAASSSLKRLLDHPALWQASVKQSSRPVFSTGYEALDQAIYDGGWPQGAVTELLLTQPGVGELRLLAPLLSKFSSQPGYLVLVAPPYLPYAPHFAQQSVLLNKLLIIRAHSVADRIWASQQALASRSCSAVVCWLPNAAAYKSELRKLTLAAHQGQSWGFVMRPVAATVHPSPARLRIKLGFQWQTQVQAPQRPRNLPGLHELEIMKQSGSWHGQKIVLNLLPEQALWTSQYAKDWPTYQTHAQRKYNETLLNHSSLTSLINDETTNQQPHTPTIVH